MKIDVPTIDVSFLLMLRINRKNITLQKLNILRKLFQMLQRIYTTIVFMSL